MGRPGSLCRETQMHFAHCRVKCTGAPLRCRQTTEYINRITYRYRVFVCGSKSREVKKKAERPAVEPADPRPLHYRTARDDLSERKKIHFRAASRRAARSEFVLAQVISPLADGTVRKLGDPLSPRGAQEAPDAHKRSGIYKNSRAVLFSLVDPLRSLRARPCSGCWRITRFFFFPRPSRGTANSRSNIIFDSADPMSFRITSWQPAPGS